MSMMRRLGLAVAVLAAAAVLTGLLAPDPRNPALDPSLDLRTVSEVPAPVADLLGRACLDCHSDETRWPWYSKVPPASWLVGHDVNEARGQMNFSRWGEYSPFERADMLDEACEQVSNGEMPLWSYRLVHSHARLTDEDVAAFCNWARAEAERILE
jgi:hypothetical protein